MNSLYYSLLRELYYESPQSIASLSHRIGKSIPITTKGIQSLLTKQLISDNGLAPSNGGRRANCYALDQVNLPYILLIAIDQKKTKLVVYDFSNNSIKPTKEITINLNNLKSFTSTLITEIDNYLDHDSLQKIVAISITMPGFVNADLGINSSFPMEDERCQIRNIIQKKYLKQTFIENDSTAIAIAEHKFGLAKDIKDVLVINLNWGVGLGMIINNVLFKGSSGYAGEFSHIPLSNLKKLCTCGKRGCLEVEASLEAAISFVTNRLNKGDSSILAVKLKENNFMSINDVLDAANKGDQLAIEAFGAIAYALGKGIATLIHIINPEKIIISGFGAELKDFLMPQIQSALLEYSIQRLSANTKIEISTLNNPQLIGTMATAVKNLDWKNILKK